MGQAPALIQRASVFGATVCACGLDGMSFSFQGDELEEAIGFVTGSDAHPIAGKYAVGIAQGALTPLMERTGAVELSLGTALVNARALAAAAHPGEVLLDSRLPTSHALAVVTRGVRRVAGTEPMEALEVDALSPWRTSAPHKSAGLHRAALVGRTEAMSVMVVEPGTLGTVRADSGWGGTRLLQECTAVAGRSPTLLVQPRGSGVEPMGALRAVWAREIALGRRKLLLPAVAATLTSILEGKGASIAAAATLLDAWLTGVTSGLLLVDDASEVDAVSIDVIACALLESAKPFRAVVRLDAMSPLPAALATLPPGPEVALPALSAAESEALSSQWLGGTLEGPAIRTWVAQSAGVPLAIAESLLEGVAYGGIVSAEGRVCLDARSAMPPGNLNAVGWVQKRLNHVSQGGRAILGAVAILGGDASAEFVSTLVESAADVPVDFDTEVAALTAAAWLEQPEPGWLALPSRTHRSVLIAALGDGRRASWHRAASLTIETHGKGLQCAEAAWHATMAGDDRRSLRLTNEAMTQAKEAKLDLAAKGFSSLLAVQARWMPEPDTGKTNSLRPRPPAMTIPPTANEALAARLVSRGRPRTTGDSYLPLELTTAALAEPKSSQEAVRLKMPQSQATQTKPSKASHPQPATQATPAPFGPPVPGPRPAPVRPEPPTKAKSAPAPSTVRMTTLAAPPRVPTASAPQTRDTFASIHSQQMLELAGRLPVLAREALQAGSESAFKTLIDELTSAGKGERIVQRLRAIASLKAGDKTKAIATLKEACEQARALGPVERSRSHLAYAVALAQTGEPTDALIEALEALSRAREGRDARAELACLLFLQRLYASGPHADLASRWSALEPLAGS